MNYRKWQTQDGAKECSDVLKESLGLRLKGPLFCPETLFIITTSNLLNVKCGRGSRGNANHLRTAHKVQVPTPIQLIQEMEVLFPRKAKGISRTSLLIAREAHINLYLRKLKDFMQTSDSHFSITK